MGQGPRSGVLQLSVRLWTTEEAASELGVPARAIRDWKTHGRAYPVDSMRGRGRNGQAPLWDLEDLRPLAEQYLTTLARRAERSNG